MCFSSSSVFLGRLERRLGEGEEEEGRRGEDGREEVNA